MLEESVARVPVCGIVETYTSATLVRINFVRKMDCEICIDISFLKFSIFLNAILLSYRIYIYIHILFLNFYTFSIRLYLNLKTHVRI